MSKVKTENTTVEIVDTDLEYPIYLNWQENDSMDEIYVKITEKYWVTLSFRWVEGTNLKRYNHNPEKPISRFHLENLTSERIWNHAVSDFKRVTNEI